MHRIKWELSCLTRHIAVIGVSAFLCAIGGILLWINGGSGWYVINSINGSNSSLTGVFLVWMIAYALYGVRLALLASGEGIACSDRKRAFTAFSLTALAYLLDLIWYAIFFCTRLTWFALVVLITAVILGAAVIILSKRGMLIHLMAIFVVILTELLFIWFTLSFLLLN